MENKNVPAVKKQNTNVVAKSNNKVVAYLGDKKLEISTPLNIGDKDIKQITLREPKVKDLKAISHIHDELEQTTTLIANLGGFTLEEVEDLPTHIYFKLSDLLKPFLHLA